MNREDELFCKCPYMAVQKLFSGKWALLILCYLRRGPLRFSELQRYMPEMTHSTLSKQLKKLEEDELITRTIFPEIPPHVEYALSPLGKETSKVLDAMSEFGFRYLSYMRENGKTDIQLCEDAMSNECRCRLTSLEA